MQLETMPALTHNHCIVASELGWADRDFAGHASVTELEICSDYFAAAEQAEQASWEAAAAAERAASRALDHDLDYAEEALLTAAGLPAYYDPQAY